MFSFDIMKYSSHALISYGGMIAYDVLVDNRGISDSYTMTDAATFALSSVFADLVYDVVSGLLPFIN